MEAKFKEIEKEKVGDLIFPNEDVLNSNKEKFQRLTALERSMALGNLEHVKVRIFFEDDKSKLFVDTTIWGVTNESVILKQGLVIPNRRIYEVN